MIEFSLSPKLEQQNMQMKMLAQGLMRPYSRDLDENEHEKPWDFINATWQVTSAQMKKKIARVEKKFPVQ